MDNSVLIVLGMLLSSSQGAMGIPNCNLTLCKCQTEKLENEESSLETKDYIIIALAIALFLLVVVLVMVGCYWKRKRNKDNTKPTENIEKQLQDKDNSINDNGNIQKKKNEIELVDDKPKTIAKEAQRKLEEKTRYTKEPSMPVVKIRTEHQSTKRRESATYANADAIVPNRKLRDRVSNLFGKFVQSFGSTPDPSETSSIDYGYVSSPFTQEHPYANASITNNDRLERQPRVCDPDDDGPYETLDALHIETNVSGGKSNRSKKSEIGENSNQTSTDSDSDSYKSARDSSGSSTMSGAETSVTQNTAHGEIKVSGSNINITANNVIVNVPN